MEQDAYRRKTKTEVFTCELATLENLQCELCDFGTNLKVGLTGHVRVLHEAEAVHQLDNILKSYHCDKCDFETYSLIVLTKHFDSCRNGQFRRTKRKYKINRIFPKENDKWYEIKIAGAIWRQCKHCDYKSASRSCMYTHNLTRHTDPKDIKWFKCDQCSFQAKQKSNLGTHQQTQHANPEDIRWFHCEHCEFRTKQKVYLKKHFLLMHTAPKARKRPQRGPRAQRPKDWVKCQQCTFETRTRALLREHVLRKHTGAEFISWFKCGQCSYKAKTVRTLNAHVCADAPKQM